MANFTFSFVRSVSTLPIPAIPWASSVIQGKARQPSVAAAAGPFRVKARESNTSAPACPEIS